MEKYKVTFVQEKQFLLGNAFVRVFIDGEACCDLKIRTGDSVERELAYGFHHMMVAGYGKQIDEDIFVKNDGTITLRWNKIWGRPEVVDLSSFRPSEAELSIDDGSAQILSCDASLPIDVSFGVTRSVGNYLWINENKKTVGVPKQNLFGKVTGITAFRFEDIVDFELIQDGSSIINKGGLGRAAIGGLLFGGSGAVVGSVTGARKQTQTCTELRIKITVNRMDDPIVYINFIKGVSYKKDSMLYRQLADNAENVMSILKIVADSASTVKETAKVEDSADSVVDEIRKYKQLFDEGIITEEEFNLKKRQLMNI